MKVTLSRGGVFEIFQTLISVFWQKFFHHFVRYVASDYYFLAESEIFAFLDAEVCGDLCGYSSLRLHLDGVFYNVSITLGVSFCPVEGCVVDLAFAASVSFKLGVVKIGTSFLGEDYCFSGLRGVTDF